MTSKKIITSIALITIASFSNCKKDKSNSEPTPVGTTNVITNQSTIQLPVTLASASGLAILAGTGITNTGATIVTGDMGLSPGTSVGGFPPGILNGVLHINDNIANQAKLDLTAAYNDAAGRSATRRRRGCDARSPHCRPRSASTAPGARRRGAGTRRRSRCCGAWCPACWAGWH